MKRKTWLAWGVAAFVSLLSVAGANGAPITPGNLLIYRVGDGAAALGTTAAAVFIDEYTITGTFVQSIALSTTGGSALTAVGNSTTEGIISPSQDGSSLLFTGYRKAAGGTSPASDSYTVSNRVVGTITLTGTPDTSTSLTNDNGSTSANAIRSATSVGGTAGSAFWVGNATRVSYSSSGLGTTAGTTQIDARNSRQVNLYNNELLASNGSTAITGKVQSYGTLPTGATAASPVVVLATGDAVNGFVAFDLTGAEAGIDTIYALSTVGSQLLKWTKSGGAWSQTSSISTTAANLTGVFNGSNVALYMTTASALLTITDSSGYGGTLSGTPTSLATAGTNTAFRGIGTLALIPEPGALSLLASTGVLLLRRRSATKLQK